MKLRDFLPYESIVIQCHDNPDADALACGFAVYLYLQSQGKKPDLIYAGRNRIRKTNLVMMVEDLGIPVRHVTKLDHTPDLLVMVDCQYGGGNSARFDAHTIAVIDHHRISTTLPELSEVRSNLGACSTLVWQMLKDEGFEIQKNRKLSTALYYGLYTDTSGLSELAHPLDKDLRDEAVFDAQLMHKYRNANLSLEDLETAGAALLHSDYNEEYRAAVVKSGPCDPNVLGIISDLVLEVDAIDTCIVFNVVQDGVKFSVRSCIKEVKANELAAELSKGIGSGGGHEAKAGGFIAMDLLTKEYLKLCEMHHFTPRMELDEESDSEHPTASGVKSVLDHRFRQYMDDTDIIYAGECRLDSSNSEHYCRKSVPWGYVRATDLAAAGSRVLVRTMHGDLNMVVEPDMILTISPMGGVLFCREDDFAKQYRSYPDWKFRLKDAEYSPTIKVEKTGMVIEPMSKAKICVPKGKLFIHARCLDRKVKLFTETDGEQHYTLGRIGDYLTDDTQQIEGVCIMKKEFFEQTYHRAGVAQEHKAVIFDLDGTLLDTLEDLKDATNAALASQGMPQCTLDQVRRYVGNGVRKLMVRAVPDGEKNPLFEQTFAAFKEYYAAHCLDHTAPYPDVLKVMKELKERGIKIAIVSNKLDSAVKELNEKFFQGYTSAAIGEMEGVARKPAPDMVEKALRELGVTKSDAIYVGDSDVDIQTAKNSGLDCISVTWGFRDVPFLLEHGAKTMIDKPLELLSQV